MGGQERHFEAKKLILEAKKTVLEAKRPILAAKRVEIKIYVDFWEGSVEWREPFGYAKSTASTAGALACFTRRGILSRMRRI